MANVDAFNAGFDAGMGKSKKSSKSGGQSDLLKQPDPGAVANPKHFKKGGKVKKTGVALVHKGEIVLTAKQAKKHKNQRKRIAPKR